MTNAMKSGTVLAAIVGALGGCVTINIYFPAAAAEKAADRIIDEVWQLPAQKSDQDGANSKEEK